MSTIQMLQYRFGKKNLYENNLFLDYFKKYKI